MIKVCKKCGAEKPISEYNKNPKTKDGYYGACKTCCAEYLKAYWKKNKDALIEKSREYKLANPLPRKTVQVTCSTCGKVMRKRTCNVKDENYCSDKCARPHKLYISKNRKVCPCCGGEFNGEKRRKYCSRKCAGKSSRVDGAAWRDPEYIKAYQRKYQRKWYSDNREKILKQAKSRHGKDPAKRQAHMVNYRAKKANLPSDFTSTDWEACLTYWGYCCAACGRPQGLFHVLAQDHWIPLTSNECPGTIPSNIIPLCHGEDGCNNSKSNRNAEEWLPYRLGKNKAKKRLALIKEYFDKVRR